MAHEGLFYAGIGSRSTPIHILSQMSQWAFVLAEAGYVLRSGAADGADAAFEQGADAARGAKEIYLPWAGFNGSSGIVPSLSRGESIVKDLHPAWPRLSQGAKKLHSRNAFQVLGPNLNSPVAFVLCWTPDAAQTHEERTSRTGGTGMAIAIASLRGIPVINMARDGWLSLVQVMLGQRHPSRPIDPSNVGGVAASPLDFLFS